MWPLASQFLPLSHEVNRTPLEATVKGRGDTLGIRQVAAVVIVFQILNEGLTDCCHVTHLKSQPPI